MEAKQFKSISLLSAPRYLSYWTPTNGNINLLGGCWFYVIFLFFLFFSSVGRYLGFGLSRECFVKIEGSQTIAFLAYQLLTLSLRVDPLTPTPFSRRSHIPLYYYYWSLLYSAIYCAHFTLMWFWTVTASFLIASFILSLYIARIFNIQRNGVLTPFFIWFLIWLVPHETAAVSVQVLHTP